MKCIIYSDNTGQLHIVHPAYNDEKTLKDAWRFVPKDAINPCEIDKPKIGRYFRNAWEWDEKSKSVVINRAKAEQIKIDKLRLLRNKKLEELDIETIKAVGAGDEVKRIEIEKIKQELRDLPQTISFNGLSIEELENYIPPILK